MPRRRFPQKLQKCFAGYETSPDSPSKRCSADNDWILIFVRTCPLKLHDVQLLSFSYRTRLQGRTPDVWGAGATKKQKGHQHAESCDTFTANQRGTLQGNLDLSIIPEGIFSNEHGRAREFGSPPVPGCVTLTELFTRHFVFREKLSRESPDNEEETKCNPPPNPVNVSSAPQSRFSIMRLCNVVALRNYWISGQEARWSSSSVFYSNWHNNRSVISHPQLPGFFKMVDIRLQELNSGGFFLFFLFFCSPLVAWRWHNSVMMVVMVVVVMGEACHLHESGLL